MSASASPTMRAPRASRCASRVRSTPPNATNARRRASDGVMPASRFFAISMSRWKRSSSSSSRSIASLEKSARSRPRIPAAIARGCQRTSGRTENQLPGARVPAPVFGFGMQLPSSQGGDAIVARSAVVLGGAPLVVDQAAVLETDQRRIDGALPHAEGVLGQLLDALRDAPAVHRLEGERLETEKVECPLEDVAGCFARHERWAPVGCRKEYFWSFRMSTGEASAAWNKSALDFFGGMLKNQPRPIDILWVDPNTPNDTLWERDRDH